MMGELEGAYPGFGDRFAALPRLEKGRALAFGVPDGTWTPGVPRAVWARVLEGEEGGVGASWLKASVAIEAHETEPWTARAVLPDGTRSDRAYSFT